MGPKFFKFWKISISRMSTKSMAVYLLGFKKRFGSIELYDVIQLLQFTHFVPVVYRIHVNFAKFSYFFFLFFKRKLIPVKYKFFHEFPGQFKTTEIVGSPVIGKAQMYHCQIFKPLK